MYTADDIRKMQASMGLTGTSERSGSSKKKYTAEDVSVIQSWNAEKGRELLRTEGRAPGAVRTERTQPELSTYDRAREEDRTVSGWLERNAPGVMDFLFPNDENERRWSDYNAWLEEDDNRERIKAVESVRHAQETGGTYSLEDVAKNSGGKWTAAQLEEAEKKLEEYEQLPGWYRLLHRPDSSATGIAREAMGGGASLAAVGMQAVADTITGSTTRADQMEGTSGALMDMALGLYEEGGKDLQEARLGLTDGQELAYNLAETTGENVLPVLLGAPWLLMGEQMARSAGAGVTDMASQGRDVGAAALSGLGHGAISYAVERAGIGQTARNIGMNTSMGQTVDGLLDAIANAPGMNRLPGWVAGTLASAGEEGAEEFVQTYLDTALDKVLGSDTPSLLSGELLGEAVQSAGMGALGGLAIGAASSGIGAVQRARQNAYQRAQQESEIQLTQTPASAALSEDLSALQAAVAPTAAPDTGTIAATQQTAPVQNQEWAAPPSVGQDGQLGADAWEQLAARQAALRAQQETANPGAPLTEQTQGQESVDVAPAAPEAQKAREVTEDPYWIREQRQEARLLAENSSMTPEAVELVVDAMPQDISGEVYTPAARMIYQIARQGLAETEAEALTLAGKSGAMVPQVMAVPGGAEALHQVWNQGRIEGLAASGYGQAGLAAAETAGTVTMEEGSFLPEEDRALLDLSAAASDTAVTVREKLENDAGGYVDTALGQIYFAAEEGQDTFGTVLHEQTHLYNALDPEGGRILQTNVLKALAESQGYEQVDSLIQSYIQRYQEVGQPISYAQACEEVAADAWRGIFGSEESFARWAQRQAAQAEKNADSRGAIRKMMDTVKGILDNIIQKAKQILAREPENTAARWAMELAESQKRALEEEYYRHQDAALEAQRTARQGGQTAANQTGEQTDRRAAQLREEADNRNGPGRKYQIPIKNDPRSQIDAYDSEVESLKEERKKVQIEKSEWENSEEVRLLNEAANEARKHGRFSAEFRAFQESPEYKEWVRKRKEYNRRIVELDRKIEETRDKMADLGKEAAKLKKASDNAAQIEYDKLADLNGGKENYRRNLAVQKFGITDRFERAGYILPDGRMLDFAQNGKVRDSDHREIIDAFGPSEVADGTEAMNKFISDGNVRVMAESPGVDISSSVEPSVQQLKKIKEMAEEFGSERHRFMLDISDETGKVVADKTYSGKIDAEKIVREIKEFYKSRELPAESELAQFRYQLPVDNAPAESGQKAAAWENVDRDQVERGLAEVYQEKNVNRIPVENLQKMARRLLKDTQSRENQITLAKKLENLGDYLSGGQVNGRTALTMAEDIAESLMRKSGRRNTELWDQYPDLHYHTLYVQRGGTEYKEVVSQYGKLGIAQKELAKYGITLTTGEAHKDSAVDVVYESLSREYPGMFPAEITDPMRQIDTIAEVRDAISIKYQNNYGENWEEAKADLAMQILGGMVREGVTDQSAAGMLTQRIDENLNRHRAEIQERTARELDLQERKARRDAYRSAKQIVNEAGKINLERSERDQKKIQELEAAAQRRAEAWAKTKGNLRTALASSRDSLQRARNARSADATRRAIASNVAKLNRMLLHPSEKSHVPVELVQDALVIAQIGNAVTYNDETLLNLQALESRMKKYAKDGGDADGLAADFEASGILEMLESLTGSMNARRSRSVRLEVQADAAARNTERGLDRMYELQGAQEEWYASAVLSENMGKNGAPRLNRLTAAEMNTIRDLTSAILTTIQNSNKLLTIQKAQRASEFAVAARSEVESSYKRLGEKPSLIKRLGLKYHENVLKAENFFAILGGYRHGGAMETMARTLSAGEARQTAIREEGIRRFSDVLDGKGNREKLKRFVGPEAKLVDVGLTSGAKVSHAQAVSLWLHLQNEQNAEHVLKGGVKIPDMKEYARGQMEEAYRKSTVEHFALDKDLDYAIQVQGIRNRIESVLDEYDWAWIRDLQSFFDEYTKQKINDTSRMLSGYDRAVVEKYFPLAVDPDALQKQIEGVVYNGTIEGRGFLKDRKQHAAQPVLLEECSQVMQRSLSDVAAYAGLAPAIRDFNKIWNANRGEDGSLKAAIRKSFGLGGVQYVEDYISDLQRQPRGRKSMLDALNGIRGRYAGAVLTLNPKVALGQISGVLGAGSELGAKHTAAAMGYMMKRLTGQLGKGEDTAIRQEMMDWGYWGLEGALSDGPTAELAELKHRKDAVSRITEKLPGANILETMDKLTREGIWVGAKGYVAEHFADYGLIREDVETRSAGYRAAVVNLATDTINRTQPNYTTSQLAAIQRNPNQLAKILTMFKTQGFQNYGVLQYAIEDYQAQRRRMTEAQQMAQQEGLSAEKRQQAAQVLETAKRQVIQAGQRLKMAVGSQAAQALVYAAIINVVSALVYHRLDDLRDEDGEITLASAMGKVLLEGTQSATTDNVFLLPEAMAVMGNLFGVRDDDPVSLTGIDAFGSLGSDFYKVYQLVTTGEMDFPTAADKLTDLAGSVFNLLGVPVAQIKRLTEGGIGWGKDIYKALTTEGIDLGDVINAPTSSSQYDDLYTAVFETDNPEDAADALEALQKLDKLNPPKKPGDAKAGDTKILFEMLKREKEFGTLIQDAAAARVSGDNATQQKLMQQLVNTLADALGIDQKTKEGQRRLTVVINKVNTAISDEMRAQMGADSSTGATIYTPVLNALETGSGLSEALSVLRRAGIQDSDIRSAVQTAYKEDYLYADDAGRAAIEGKLLRLKDADGEAYFTEKDFSGWIMDWTLKGFNDSVYTDLDEALQTRNQITAQEEIYRYMEAGKSAGSIRDRITALFKDEYLKASTAQRQEIAKFLVRLRGPGGEKLVTVDTLTGWIKDEAKKKAGR